MTYDTNSATQFVGEEELRPSSPYYTEPKPKPSNVSSLDRSLRSAEVTLEQEEARNVNARSQEIAESAAMAGVGNVEKIRDILFGNYIRDYEKRFKRVEERLTQESIHLREDLLQRIKTLEDTLTQETDNLSEKIKSERQERVVSVQDIAQELSILKNELNARFAAIDEQIIKEVKQVRQQLHNRFQELTTQLRQQGDTLSAAFKQELSQLQEEKVNRSDLAAFFTEFAFRLNRDFNTAGSGHES